MTSDVAHKPDQQPTLTRRVELFVRNFVFPLMLNGFVLVVAAIWSLMIFFRMARRYGKQPGKLFARQKRPLPPKILNNPDFGNHCYIQLPNIKLHYVESGDKSKPLMILLHGFPEFWYAWRHQIKEFSKDYWVVAVDMRGYGDSEKPPHHKYYQMKYLVEDVKNLIEGLGREKGILVAHDWGGMVAWAAVMRYPQIVEKFVILNAPHPTAFRKIIFGTLGQFLKSWYMFFFQLPFLPETWLLADDLAVFKMFFRSKKHGSVLTEEDTEAYKFTFGKPGAFWGPIAYYRANLFRRTKKSKKTDETIAAELPKGIFLFGDDDVALDSKLVDLSKKMYPNLTTEIIPGACHFVQEDEPEIVNNKIREFLAA